MAVCARKWLKANPDSCRILNQQAPAGEQLMRAAVALQKVGLDPNKIPNSGSSRTAIRGNPNFVHIHGSELCITAFLGEKNWSRSKRKHFKIRCLF